MIHSKILVSSQYLTCELDVLFDTADKLHERYWQVQRASLVLHAVLRLRCYMTYTIILWQARINQLVDVQ